MILLSLGTLAIYLRLTYPTINIGLWDFAIVADGAWRIINDQIPHLNFSTPLGPVIFWVGALGMKLAGLTLMGFNLGFCIVGAMVTILIFLIGSNRMSLLWAFFYTLICGSYLLTPRILHYTEAQLGFVGSYNTLAFGLLFLIFVDLFPISQSNLDSKKEFGFGFLTGAATAILFFLKITFGFIAVGFLAYKLLFLKNRKPHALGMFAGLTTLLLALWAYFGFNFRPMLRDLAIVGHSRLSAFSFLNFSLITDIVWFADCWCLLGTFLLCKMFQRINERYSYSKRHISHYFSQESLFFVLMINVVGIMIIRTITQPPEFVIAGPIAIILLNNCRFRITRFHSLRNALSILLIGFLLSCGTFLWVEPLRKNLAAFGVMQAIHQSNSCGHLNGVNMSDGCITDNTNRQNDAFKALRTIVHSDDHVMSVGENNIYSLTLNLKPPKNNILYWHKGVTFNETVLDEFSIFNSETLFQDVTIVMIPINRDASWSKPFFSKYYSFLKKTFTHKIRTEYWDIFLKN